MHQLQVGEGGKKHPRKLELQNLEGNWMGRISEASQVTVAKRRLLKPFAVHF